MSLHVHMSADMWFARDEGDGECTRLLHAAPLNTTTTSGPRRYKVTVRTSDVRGAGTDANVSITLFGTATPGISSGPHKLENSANNFERGASDVFEVEAREALGMLSALRIGHDNTGLGPSWHLQVSQETLTGSDMARHVHHHTSTCAG